MQSPDNLKVMAAMIAGGIASHAPSHDWHWSDEDIAAKSLSIARAISKRVELEASVLEHQVEIMDKFFPAPERGGEGIAQHLGEAGVYISDGKGSVRKANGEEEAEIMAKFFPPPERGIESAST